MHVGLAQAVEQMVQVAGRPEFHAQFRGEMARLGLPVVHDGFGADDERGRRLSPTSPFVPAPAPAAGAVFSPRSQSSQPRACTVLTQAHVIGQDAAEVVGGQIGEKNEKPSSW